MNRANCRSDMAGYIKLYRTLLNHDLWKDKPFSRGQAWIDLLATANYTDRPVMFDGSLIPVSSGSFITSKRKLSDRWGWSSTKVSRFLDALETDGMLIQKSDTKKTLLTIEKWDFYQGGCDTEESPKYHQSNTEVSPKNTDKKEKKEEESKEDTLGGESLRFTPPKEEDVKAYCEERKNGIDPAMFVNFYAAKGWMVGKSKMKDWKACVRTWEQKRKAEQPPPPKAQPKGHLVIVKTEFGYDEEKWVPDPEDDE